MAPIRTLIVDDEPLARRRIRRLLEAEPDIFLTGECETGKEALRILQTQPVDLVFLDIHMPELDGFEVLEQLDAHRLPVIVFVTAYDKYALKAFEVHAVDYLLKPFDNTRFVSALNHAREQLNNLNPHSLKQRLLDFLADFSPGGIHESGSHSMNKYADRLVVKSAGRIFFLKTAEICRIKAAGKYLEIRAGDTEYSVRQTMNEIETKLNPNKFLRIHRSTIINIDFIREMQHWYKGEYIFILQNGEKFTSSHTYRFNLEKLMQHFS